MDEREEGPAPAGRRRRGFGTGVLAGVLGVGLAVTAVMAGLNVASAQSGSSSTPRAGTTTPPVGGPMGPGPFGFGMGSLHGEFVVPAPGGGYETLATQTGTVTAVGSSSVTVKSDDGFSRTYAVGDNTAVNAGNNGISDVKSGDTVHVTAVVNGGKATAVDLVDQTRLQQIGSTWMPAFPGPAAGSGSSSSSSSSTSA